MRMPASEATLAYLEAAAEDLVDAYRDLLGHVAEPILAAAYREVLLG